jgi:ribosome-binding protein aMBF1 (putative translation factor)
MTISREQLTSDNSGEIREFWKEYFSETLRHIVNEQLNEAIVLRGLSKAEIAKRLKKRPEQITRWLSSPCNLELDTLSDLALALEMRVQVELNPIESYFDEVRSHAPEVRVIHIDVSDADYVKRGIALMSDG